MFYRMSASALLQPDITGTSPTPQCQLSQLDGSCGLPDTNDSFVGARTISGILKLTYPFDSEDQAGY